MSIPLIRADGIEVNEVADGFVVYDRERDRVHYLNPTASLVLEMCTGGNSEAAIARFLQVAYELPAPPVTEVCACLAQLREQRLVS